MKIDNNKKKNREKTVIGKKKIGKNVWLVKKKIGKNCWSAKNISHLAKI